jgi:hypothetical protein
MKCMVEVYAQYYTTHLRFLLPDVLRLLHSCCISQEVDGFPSIGVSCLKQLLMESGSDFDGDVWVSVCAEIDTLFEETMPWQVGESRFVLALGTCVYQM